MKRKSSKELLREAVKFMFENGMLKINVSPEEFLEQIANILSIAFYDGFTLFGYDMTCRYYSGQVYKVTAVEVTDEKEKRELVEKLLAEHGLEN